jgi:hypothetical protein
MAAFEVAAAMAKAMGEGFAFLTNLELRTADGDSDNAARKQNYVARAERLGDVFGPAMRTAFLEGFAAKIDFAAPDTWQELLRREGGNGTEGGNDA